MSRRILIAGNWKMNKTSAEGVALVKEIAAGLPAGSLPEILVCPPYLTIPAVVAAAKGTAIDVGAENVHWAASGAFTGEVSAAMLLEHFGLNKEGALVREAVTASLDANVRTPEIQVEGGAKYGTKEVGEWIVNYIKNA
jgi:hypothetical protein